MLNYGIFTQIYVLQGFNAKEAKRVGKTTKMAKAENIKYRDKLIRQSAKFGRNKQNCVTTKTKHSAR